MIKSAFENNHVLYLTLVFCLLSCLAVCSSCRKKEEPEDAQQAVSPDRSERVRASEQIEQAGTPATHGLRILYAGHPSSEREKDFVDFLGRHFKSVETADLKSFKEEQSDNFDVTIFDYDGDGFKAPRPRLSRDFSRPVITVGVAGGLMCLGWNLKTGYL